MSHDPYKDADRHIWPHYGHDNDIPVADLIEMQKRFDAECGISAAERRQFEREDVFVRWGIPAAVLASICIWGLFWAWIIG